MFELLKRAFELFVQKQWLISINGAYDKYSKLKRKADAQLYAADCLLKEYNKKYNLSEREEN